MLVRAPYSFLFILAICCWFRHNAAIPLAAHSSDQDTFKEKKTDSQTDLDDTTFDSRSMSETKISDSSDEDDEGEKFDEDDENDENDENQNTISNVNRNVNINANIFNRGKHHRIAHNRERHKQSTTEAITTVTDYGTLVPIVTEEASTNCANGKKKNQRYSSSFLGNTTDHALTVEKEFHNVVGNNSKVKKSGSVHEGEDITLCWIETTTIKEDTSVRPPKRLVIREYTISFENSATIPERYLECKKYEGELTANDPDVGKTALFEIIDEDTMVSKVVNFTSVSHVCNITIWQHKKVKCGVGPVVSKNIIELTDGSKNPKKRVEIKVSPKMHQLTATTDEEPCTDSTEKIVRSSEPTESTEPTTGLSCENGVCEPTTISPGVSTKIGNEATGTTEETVESTSEKAHSTIVTKSLTPEEVSRRSTTFPKMSTIRKNQEKIDCEENSSDPACLTQKPDTSSTELPPDLSTEIPTTEIITMAGRTTQSSSREKKKVTSDLITEETTPFVIVTDISIESSEGPGFTEPTSKTDKIDHVSSSSTDIVSSSEIDNGPDITTAKPVIELIGFTKRPDKPGQSLDKLTDSPISIERTTADILTESSSASQEVSSTRTSSTKVRSTTLPPVISSETSCENSEECAYTTSPEVCDEFGNCGETTTRCDGEGCSVKESTVDRSKFNTNPPTKVPSSTTGSQSSEETTMIDKQHTTVANVATTILTSRESENISTSVDTVPITMDSRRSTTTSTPRHKLTLKVKVLLEHINENKEKHNLVEVEKHLLLDENPEHHGNPDLVEQLKSLNDSVNKETISALLNCTSLGNLTRDASFINKELNDAVDDSDEELEFTNSDQEDDPISEQFVSAYADDKNDYSEYEEVSSRRRRRRRSLDNEMEELNKFVRNLHNSTDSVIDSSNISKSESDNLQSDNFSTTTNYTEEETTENVSNVTEKADESTLPSTTVNIIDLSNASESHDVNLTKENVQLITTTNKPEVETSNVYIENEKNINQNQNINESVVPLTKENISNETKMEVVRETLPGIQEDVVVGLQHMASQLAQSNLSSINNIKEAVKTNLLDILADPKDTRIRSRRRRRRAATEELGHWSNERITEAPMGGNLRSLTEFTLYKVLP